jgi:hypothetical protein
MEAIASSEELSIFTTDLVMDLIDFKWERFAFKQHMFGAFIHFTYVMVLIYYINFTFLVEKATWMDPDTETDYDKKMDCEDISEKDCLRISPAADAIYLYIIFGCLLYPLIYDGTQALKQGSQYLADPWNYMDMLHITLGYGNIYCQLNIGTWELTSKIVMIFVTIVCLIKTFFFMRIVKSFSYIVTMIINVIIDLEVFMLFFLILIIMFSMIFDVIAPNPASEYKYVGLYWGNVLTTLRLSLGDFDFGVLETTGEMELNKKQHILFWCTWVLMVIFSSLIFLNFIIAEVSNSYSKVKEKIDELIYKERAGLINEAEDIKMQATKLNNKK